MNHWDSRQASLCPRKQLQQTAAVVYGHGRYQPIRTAETNGLYKCGIYMAVLGALGFLLILALYGLGLGLAK